VEGSDGKQVPITYSSLIHSTCSFSCGDHFSFEAAPHVCAVMQGKETNFQAGVEVIATPASEVELQPTHTSISLLGHPTGSLQALIIP
jgi:hypothetical protein